MTVYQATTVPRLRDGLVSFVESGSLDVLLRNHRGAVRTPIGANGRPVSIDTYIGMLAGWLRAAELFFVTAPMCAVVAQAARSQPGYRMLREDQPAPVGLVFWETPVAEAAQGPPAEDPHNDPRPKPIKVHAALWAPTRFDDGQPGTMIVEWSDTDALVADLPPELGNVAASTRETIGPLAYYDEVVLPVGELPDKRMGNWALAAVTTTWLLMGQRIAVTSDHQYPRGVRRAAERAGETLPLVRTTTLRRPANPKRADPDGQAPTREYHHQWIVTGHWRDHWYPSQQRHKPLYIADFVKGPEGAPMIGGERVSVLRR